MEALQIAETTETPSISLDKTLGVFQIAGRSICDNPTIFYEPALRWLKKYAEAPNPATVITFKFDYLNTGSSKSILDILTVLESINGATVSWYFSEDDEDMEEIGEELAELVQIPFEFKSY